MGVKFLYQLVTLKLTFCNLLIRQEHWYKQFASQCNFSDQ